MKKNDDPWTLNAFAIRATLPPPLLEYEARLSKGALRATVTIKPNLDEVHVAFRLHGGESSYACAEAARFAAGAFDFRGDCEAGLMEEGDALEVEPMLKDSDADVGLSGSSAHIFTTAYFEVDFDAEYARATGSL